MSLTPELYRQLKELFGEAVELEGHGLESLLARAASIDPWLRHELEQLLDASIGTEGLVGAVREGLTEMVELQPGARVGDFEIVKILGRGGMGVVYEAVDRGHLERPVALKMVASAVPDPALLARFELERRLMASLSHPAVARVYEAGVGSQGRPWMAMGLVEGQEIVDAVDDASLSIDDRLKVVIEVCEGVQHAHDRGLLHRDLKPSNILVDADLRPKIIDFGIAKAIDGVGQATRGAIGSPRWMSPEQLEGRDDLDVRTDVYALGVILYQMVCGELPHDWDRGLGAGMRDTVDGTTRSPSSRLRKLAPEELDRRSSARGSTAPRLARRLAGDLDRIVLAAIAGDREHRYRSAAALAEDLRRFLAGEAVSVGPATELYRLSRFAARHRWLVAAVLTALLATLAGTATTIVQARRANERAQAARLSAEESDEVASLLVSLFNGAAPGRASAQEPTASELLVSGEKRIREQLGDRRRVRGRLLLDIGNVHRLLADRDAARLCYEDALTDRMAAVGEHDVVVADAINNLAILDMDAEAYDEAKRGFERAGAIYEELGELTGRLANVEGNLGLVARRTERFEEAEVHLLRALELRRSTFGAESAEVAHSLNNLGSMYYHADRIEDSMRAEEQSLELRRRIFGNDHVEVAGSLNNVAVNLKKLERWDEAESAYREALGIYEAVLGAASDRTGIAAFNLGLLLRGQERPADALPLFARAADSFAEGLSPGHSLTVRALQYTLATAEELSNELALDRACAQWTRALAAGATTTEDDLSQIADLCSAYD